MELRKERGITRREFLTGAAVVAGTIAVDEGHRRLTGFGLESPVLSYLAKDNPIFPFSPALMKYYFETANRVPGFSELKETIKERVIGNRPASVQELIEIGLEKANSQGVTGENGVRLALFALAAIGQTGWQGNDAKFYYPLYLPEGKRPEERRFALGWDKTVHLTSDAYFAYELLRLSNTGGIREARKADEFIIGLRRAIWLVGPDRISQIKECLRGDSKRNFPFNPSIQGLTSPEEAIADLLINGGVAFEAFTISERPEEVFDPRLRERTAMWMLLQKVTGHEEKIDEFIWKALKEPKESIVNGLGDTGINRDLVANQVGIALGISLYRQRNEPDLANSILEIPFDDYSKRFRPYEGGVDQWGESIGKPPKPYPPVSDYKIALNSEGKIELFVMP